MKKHFIRPQAETGSVLVLVVFVMMLLSIWVIQFAQATLLFQKGAGALLERKKAYQAARAGLEYGLSELQKNAPEEFETERAVGDSRFAVKVRNEDGKWDLNSLVDGDGNLIAPQADGLKRCLEKIGFGKEKNELVDCFADWIDADNDRREFGAEDADYLQHGCSNGVFLTAGELRQVKGVGSVEKARRLRLGVTPYSTGKVNVNTAPLEVLESLSGKMNQPVAETILKLRQQKPFGQISELKSVLGMTDALYSELEKIVTVRGKYYTVLATGACGKTSVRLGGVAKRNQDGMKWVELKEPLQNEDLLDLD